MSQTPAEAAGEALARLVDRLRSMPQSRLSRPTGSHSGASVADRCYTLSTWCVAAEAGVVGRADPAPPLPRALPRLADLGSGDQVRVVALDLLVALSGVEPDAQVWLEGQRVGARAVLSGLTERVTTVRSLT